MHTITCYLPPVCVPQGCPSPCNTLLLSLSCAGGIVECVCGGAGGGAGFAFSHACHSPIKQLNQNSYSTPPRCSGPQWLWQTRGHRSMCVYVTVCEYARCWVQSSQALLALLWLIGMIWSFLYIQVNTTRLQHDPFMSRVHIRWPLGREFRPLAHISPLVSCACHPAISNVEPEG